LVTKLDLRKLDLGFLFLGKYEQSYFGKGEISPKYHHFGKRYRAPPGLIKCLPRNLKLTL